MPNPTPIYTVTYGGTQLPGYVQSDDRPVSLRSVDSSLFGRDTFASAFAGTSPREITLPFLLLSDPDITNGLLQLEDVQNQYRTALAILTRNPGMKALVIHDSDRYYMAKVENVSGTMAAGSSRKLVYTVKWKAQPWAISTTEQTDTFTGNGAVQINIGIASRKTYPIFTIPAGVTGFTATDENGKVLTFLRGAATGIITVDCGEITAVNDSGVNAIDTMDTLGFGLYYSGTDGLYDITITGFAGSGTVTVGMRARYEL